MLIGMRLKELREEQDLSQGDIESRSGLLRCYISRVENGHTVPSVETLEKLARALDVPIYRLFYDGAENLAPIGPPPADRDRWGSSGRPRMYLARLVDALKTMKASDRELLMLLARKVCARKD